MLCLMLFVVQITKSDVGYVFSGLSFRSINAFIRVFAQNCDRPVRNRGSGSYWPTTIGYSSGNFNLRYHIRFLITLILRTTNTSPRQAHLRLSIPLEEALAHRSILLRLTYTLSLHYWKHKWRACKRRQWNHANCPLPLVQRLPQPTHGSRMDLIGGKLKDSVPV